MNRAEAIRSIAKIIHDGVTDATFRQVHGPDSPNLAVNPAYAVMRLVEMHAGKDWDDMAPSTEVTNAEHQALGLVSDERARGSVALGRSYQPHSER